MSRILKIYGGISHEVVVGDGVLQIQGVTVGKAITFGVSHIPHLLQEFLRLNRAEVLVYSGTLKGMSTCRPFCIFLNREAGT